MNKQITLALLKGSHLDVFINNSYQASIQRDSVDELVGYTSGSVTFRKGRVLYTLNSNGSQVATRNI